MGAAIVHRGASAGASAPSRSRARRPSHSRCRAARSSAARAPSMAWPTTAAIRGLRRLGGRRQSRLELERGAAVFPPSENNADLRDPPCTASTGPIHVTHIPQAQSAEPGLPRAFAALGGYPACADFTGLDPRRLRPAPGHDPSRPARFHRDRLSCMPALAAAESHGAHATRRSRAIRIEGGRATGVDVAATPTGRASSRARARCCCVPARSIRRSC